NIDLIAKKGVRFRNCFAASSPCVPSRGSFMSGRFGINHGALTHWGPECDFYYPEGDGDSQKFPLFTRYIREANMKTVTFSSFGDRHHAWWYFAGWNEVHTHTLKEGNENADQVIDSVRPWLEKYGTEDNYFLHIQFWDPHTLYTCPVEYTEKWNKESAPSFPCSSDIDKHKKDSFPRSANFLHTVEKIPETMPENIKSREDFVQLVDGYDGAINYMDEQIGKILQTLKNLGLEDEVTFVISADHGESMGEQGIYGEHASATESVHHLPLIISSPGLTKPNSEYNGFLYNVDVIATITDMLGLEIPEGWDGYSFLPALKGRKQHGRQYLIMDYALFTCQRSVRDDQWYFIRTYHPSLYNFDKVTLFNIKEDPYQRNNVANLFPEIVEKMDSRIMDWIHENLTPPIHLIAPLQKVIETGSWEYTTLEGRIAHLEKEVVPAKLSPGAK